MTYDRETRLWQHLLEEGGESDYHLSTRIYHMCEFVFFCFNLISHSNRVSHMHGHKDLNTN